MNRAHKIAERLGSRQGELRTQAQSLSALVVLNGYSNQQIVRLCDTKDQVMTKIDEQAIAANAQAVVRAAIGRGNADHGVNDILAQIEANKKIISCLTEVIDNQEESSRGNGIIKLAELSGYKPISQSDGILRGSSISVSVMNDALVKSLKVQKELLEKANFSLTDRLADLNGKTISFEMETEIAELMGL